MSGKSLEDRIEQLQSFVENDDCSVDHIVDLLNELTQQLTQHQHSALAFIAETAVSSCSARAVDEPSMRIALIELCDRLLKSVLSLQPFDFSGAHPALEELLFPPQPASSFSAQSSSSSSGPHEEDESADYGDGFDQCEGDEELMQEFLAEAFEHLEHAEQILLTVEANPDDSDAINELFRVVHSIKGSAGVVELKALGLLSHLAESVMVRVRNGELAFSGLVLDAIFVSIDYIDKQLQQVRECHHAKKLIRYEKAPPVLLKCLESLHASGSCDADALAHIKEEFQSSSEQTSVHATASGHPNESLRVDGKRLEQLIDLIGELVITEAFVQRELGSRGNLSAASVSSRLRKVVKDVQQLSLTLKMVPIGTVFQKMNRMVRDLSAKLDKPTKLVILGGDTEVDRTLLEGIADPLVHLIRNSIDHGIEPTIEERRRAGKQDTATVKLSAEHRAGSVHLTISDDGRGLNRKKIFDIAVERGLISRDASLSESQIDNLIFEPGFSTTEIISDVSGRGVGMDVVKKNVEAMRGTIILTSEPGVGTQIRLELPLTLSIIDGTVVRVGYRNFIIPTLSVIEQIQAAALEYSQTETHRMVQFRGRYLVVDQLGHILATEHSLQPKHGQVCMVVEACGRQHALLVDEVLGQQSIVIKPLGGVLEGFEYFAGGALLPDGSVGFVLDLNTVCRVHRRHTPVETTQVN